MREIKYMTTRKGVKAARPKIVGVIASLDDLRFALRMKEPPDLFELRLDCLCGVLNQLERRMSTLRAPKIITARDHREGGIENLSFQERAEMLRRFLPHAKYIDVELRSARAFQPLLAQARKRNIRVILSFHDVGSTPSSRSLCAKAAAAKKLRADVFKVATHTAKPSELARLIDFVAKRDADLPISAMGMGRLGRISRLLLAGYGSILNYASLRQSLVEGQLSIDVLRSALPARRP